MTDASPEAPTTETAPKQQKRKGGRGKPAPYIQHAALSAALAIQTDEVPVEWLARLLVAGLTTEQCAICFGVSKKTVDTWKGSAAFASLVQEMPNLADDLVKKSLFQRALGYTYTAERAVVVDKRVEVVQYQEHVPGEVNAMMFWLINRAPKDWSHKPIDQLPPELRLIIQRIDQIAPQQQQQDLKPAPVLTEAVVLPAEYSEGGGAQR